MINKKNVLGKHPFDLGVKDAIHTAIVSVRAGGPVSPGERCGLNEFNEAVPDDKGCGVADPFLRMKIATGESFWLLLDQDEVPNVQHVWEHPKVAFAPPTREPERNRELARIAEELEITYEQLMASIAKAVETEDSVPYPGKLDAKTVESVMDDNSYDIWSEWADETGHEFYNAGTECCPEYSYPDCALFDVG